MCFRNSKKKEHIEKMELKASARLVCVYCARSFEASDHGKHESQCFKTMQMSLDDEHEPGRVVESKSPVASPRKRHRQSSDDSSLSQATKLSFSFDAVVASVRSTFADVESSAFLSRPQFDRFLASLIDAHKSDMNACHVQYQERLSQMALDHLHQQEQMQRELDEERGRLVAEQMDQLEKDKSAERKKLRAQADEFSCERIRLEEEKNKELRKLEEAKHKEIEELKKQTERIQAEMSRVTSSSAKKLPEEEEAMHTRKLCKIDLFASSSFSDSPGDLHFRLAESQFYRMCGVASAKYRVIKVTLVVNPELIDRYEKTLRELRSRSPHKDVPQYLTFHGTKHEAIDSIVKMGYKVGGKGVRMQHGNAHGEGIYSSEDPSFCMKYIPDRRSELLLNMVSFNVGVDTIVKGENGIIEQLITKNTDQVLPRYIVNFAKVDEE